MPKMRIVEVLMFAILFSMVFSPVCFAEESTRDILSDYDPTEATVEPPEVEGASATTSPSGPGPSSGTESLGDSGIPAGSGNFADSTMVSVGLEITLSHQITEMVRSLIQLVSMFLRGVFGVPIDFTGILSQEVLSPAILSPAGTPDTAKPPDSSPAASAPDTGDSSNTSSSAGVPQGPDGSEPSEPSEPSETSETSESARPSDPPDSSGATDAASVPATAGVPAVAGVPETLGTPDVSGNSDSETPPSSPERADAAGSPPSGDGQADGQIEDDENSGPEINDSGTDSPGPTPPAAQVPSEEQRSRAVIDATDVLRRAGFRQGENYQRALTDTGRRARMATAWQSSMRDHSTSDQQVSWRTLRDNLRGASDGQVRNFAEAYVRDRTQPGGPFAHYSAESRAALTDTLETELRQQRDGANRDRQLSAIQPAGTQGLPPVDPARTNAMPAPEREPIIQRLDNWERETLRRVHEAYTRAGYREGSIEYERAMSRVHSARMTYQTAVFYGAGANTFPGTTGGRYVTAVGRGNPDILRGYDTISPALTDETQERMAGVLLGAPVTADAEAMEVGRAWGTWRDHR
jgi:hypothetical protein